MNQAHRQICSICTDAFSVPSHCKKYSPARCASVARPPHTRRLRAYKKLAHKAPANRQTAQGHCQLYIAQAKLDASNAKTTTPSRRTGAGAPIDQDWALRVGQSSLAKTTNHHRTVRAAKPKGVGQGHINLHITRLVGAVIQVASRVLVKDIDGRR